MKRLILSIFIALGPLLIMLASSAVLAQADPNPLNAACQGQAASSPACQQAAAQGNTDPINDGLINQIIQVVAAIAGIGAVIAMILGGAKLITSGGDQQKVKAGRDQILAGAIGTVVIIASYTIISFVVGQLIR